MLPEETVFIRLENEPDNFVGLTAFLFEFQNCIEPSYTLTATCEQFPNKPIVLTGMSGAKNIVFHVQNHLMNTGDAEIKFSIKDRNGKAIYRYSQAVPFRRSSQLSESVRSMLAAHDVDWGFFGPCDSGYFPYDAIRSDDPLTPWFDRPDSETHIEALQSSGSITDDEAKLLRDFVRDGLIIIEDLIDDRLIDAVNHEIDDAISKKYRGYEYGSSQRIEHLHYHYPAINKLWLDPRHRRFNNLLFDGIARPCQTLTFVFGSQQDLHQDLMHLTTFPAGYMTGTWIALQDVAAESGELVYYPGSHRTKKLYLKDTAAVKVTHGRSWDDFCKVVLPIWANMAESFSPVVYRPRRGTVAIWHENLIHGGSIRSNMELERRSIVIHAYAEGSIAYADSWGGAAVAAPLSALRTGESPEHFRYRHPLR